MWPPTRFELPAATKRPIQLQSASGRYVGHLRSAFLLQPEILLKDQLRSEQHGSRRRPCTSDLAERTAGRSSVRRQELRMIQCVDRIDAELQVEPFSYRDVFEQ